MIARLARLVSEIRDVVPGTRSVTAHHGLAHVLVETAAHVRAFAAEHGVEALEHQYEGHRWIAAVVHVDDTEIKVSGPHTKTSKEDA